MLFERTKSGTLENEKTIAEKVTLEAIKMFGDETNWQDKKGGYWMLADGQTGEPNIILLSGHVDPEMTARFFKNCHEKAERLASRLTHVSSWQSRHPESGKYAGAIRTRKAILSMSGLPEHGDEIVMLRLALELHLLSLNRAKKIARISGNPYAKDFLRFKF